ncbi:hypothetical protein ABIA22_000387 [Sinorhizobium fredii]
MSEDRSRLESPLLALVKALAIRQARLDANLPQPANENEPIKGSARQQ